MSHPQVQRMLREWRGSRRLRLGALVVLGILGTQATLALSDGLRAREEAFRRQAGLLGRLEEASREAGWPARAKAAEAALAQERHAIPPARSDGLAQAEMQAWLTDLAAYAGLSASAVRVETSLPVPGQPGIWQVLARLDAQASPAAVPVLVRALTSALPWVRTERLEVGSGDNARVLLIVRGYYRQGDELDAKAPPPRPAELPAASREAVGTATKQPRNPLAREAVAPSSRSTAKPSRVAPAAPSAPSAAPAGNTAGPSRTSWRTPPEKR